MTAESGSRTMLYRRAHAIAALAAFFLMGLWTAPLPADDGLASQRALYPRALAALAEGRAGEFASLKERLRDYPLYPYLEYREYQAHPQRLDAGKARCGERAATRISSLSSIRASPASNSAATITC